jgi:signal peptidase II
MSRRSSPTGTIPLLRFRGTLALPVGLALIVFGMDQMLKSIVVRSMQVGESTSIVSDVMLVTRVANEGGLWGMSLGPAPVLIALSALALVALAYAFVSARSSGLVARLALGAVIGGAAGNVLDRVRIGSVVDYVDVGFGSTRWPAFNLADASIVVGVVVLVMVLGRKRKSDAAIEDVLNS